MSTILRPTITTAGLQAVFTANHNGLEARIASVALGEAAYAPDAGRTRLDAEKCMVRLIFATINCSMTGLVCANVFGVLLGALATRSTMRSALDYSQKTESLK